MVGRGYRAEGNKEEKKNGTVIAESIKYKIKFKKKDLHSQLETSGKTHEYRSFAVE